MNVSLKLVAGVAALAAFAAMNSHEVRAEARSYSQPKFLGQPVDRCLSGGDSCGKIAADAFCRLKGYENALNFRLQRDPAQISTSILVDSGKLLRVPAALPFQMVKCWRPNAMPKAVQFGVESLVSPVMCDLGEDCRKSAADQWCERKGYALGASEYAVDPAKAVFMSISCATL